MRSKSLDECYPKVIIIATHGQLPRIRYRGAILSVKVCVAAPILCVLVDSVFSIPQLKVRSSSLRTSRSILTVKVRTALRVRRMRIRPPGCEWLV